MKLKNLLQEIDSQQIDSQHNRPRFSTWNKDGLYNVYKKAFLENGYNELQFNELFYKFWDNYTGRYKNTFKHALFVRKQLHDKLWN